MKYLSVCSGIEAASAAWHCLGWQPLAFSEIEPFPRAVLAHHYPGVPLHGDFTKLRDEPWIVDADILVGGTPCQAFSVAGLRNSLADDRGNLTLEFVRLADAIDDVRHDAGRPGGIIVWENVPGVLSVKDNAFGCFLAALAGEDTAILPTGGRWTDFGLVDGPRRRIAWRVLDAQYFGLAQRRRRVFVVASSRDGFDPLAVLSQPHGVQRYSPPRRETSKGTACGVEIGPSGGCFTDLNPTLDARAKDGPIRNQLAGAVLEGNWPADLAPTLNAHFGEKQGLEDQHIRGGQGYSFPQLSMCLNAGAMGRCDAETETLIPTIGCVFDETIPIQEVGKRTGTSTDDPRAGIGIGQDGDPMYTLQAGAQHGVAAYAFQPRIARNGRGDMGDVVNALNAQSGETGKGDAAPCVAVAFAQNTRDEVREMAYVGALAAEPGMKQTSYIRQHMAVRRLTPVECERLQGFPDNYTAIPWKKKPADQCPDGPRYKALGNSMAVPVMRWIGRQIAAELTRASQSEKDAAA